ncbi:MAG: Gldg family protein [Desulfobacteraceae bacterium]
MNAPMQRYAKYIKLLLYVSVIVLINLAGITLFFRSDLTGNKIYSLSEVSKQVVATLSEPLTIKVFFTKDLPAPHNNTQRYLQDLLGEYALHNKKHFKAQFYNVTPETEGISDDARDNRETARNYGIHPVQIQTVEKDEVKFKQAFMGLVLIHGDVIERIPTITSTDRLEYKITTAIQKLNHKVSALLNLEENIRVDLVLSSSLYKVAPYIGLEALQQYPQQVKNIVEKLNAKNYNKLSFQHLDPTADPSAAEKLRDHNLMRLNWPAIAEANVEPGQGDIGLLLKYKQQVREIALLQVINLPIFGRQYQLTDVEQVEEIINTNLERLVNINQSIGYLADHGTLEAASLGPMGQRGGPSLRNFRTLIDKSYSLQSIRLKEDPIPDGIRCLIVARPTEKLSDYALYQIDQALMRGTNLAIFTDAFKEVQPAGQQQFMGNQMPTFVPMDTGLEKLLEHYGVRIKKSLVLDENCFRQRRPQRQGGGEQAIYFAPIIQSEKINKDLDYIKNIKGLVSLKISPLELDQKRIEAQQITAHRLFASSERSWEMRDRINLNPMFLRPPASDSEMSSQPLAYLLEGAFSSYFEGKPMPEKPEEESAANSAQDQDKESDESSTVQESDLTKEERAKVDSSGTFIKKSPPSKILVIASSEMISDQLLDEGGQGINSMFVLNTIDALNDRGSIAVMRSKQQSFNPLKETGAATKVLIKTANIVGLPILVVIFGCAVWLRRHGRKKRIQMQFQSESSV